MIHESDIGSEHTAANTSETPNLYPQGAPFEVRLMHLLEFVASDELTQAQKDQFADTIANVLERELVRNSGLAQKRRTHEENKEILAHLLPNTIEQHFHRAKDPFDAFLKAVQDPVNGLTTDHPVFNYVSPYKARPPIIVVNEFNEMATPYGTKRYPQGESLSSTQTGLGRAGNVPHALALATAGLLKAFERHAKAIAVNMSDPTPAGDDRANQLRAAGKKHASAGLAEARRTMRDGITPEQRRKRNRVLGGAAATLTGGVLAVLATTRGTNTTTSIGLDAQNTSVVKNELPPVLETPGVPVASRTSKFVNTASEIVTVKPAETAPPKPKTDIADGKRIYTVYTTPENFLAIKNQMPGLKQTLHCLIATRGIPPASEEEWQHFKNMGEAEIDNFNINGMIVDKIAISFVPDFNSKKLLRSFDGLSFIASAKEPGNNVKALDSLAQLSNLMSISDVTEPTDPKEAARLLSGSYANLMYHTSSAPEMLSSIGYGGDPDPAVEAQRLKGITNFQKERWQQLSGLPMDEMVSNVENLSDSPAHGIRLLAQSIVEQSPVPTQQRTR